MKGANTIIMNAATMQEAVRFYLENKVFRRGDFKVVSVTAFDSYSFKVEIQEVESDIKVEVITGHMGSCIDLATDNLTPQDYICGDFILVKSRLLEKGFTWINTNGLFTNGSASLVFCHVPQTYLPRPPWYYNASGLQTIIKKFPGFSLEKHHE